MRSWRRLLAVALVLGVAVLVSGCSIWPFSLWTQKPSRYGIAWAVSSLGGQLPAAAFASRTLFATPVLAQSSGIEYDGNPTGIYIEEREPFSSPSRLAFYAWEDTGSGRVQVSAQWSVSPSDLCKESSGHGTRFICEPARAGFGTVTAVIGSTQVQRQVTIYPGAMLDNGHEHPSGLDGGAGNRGNVGIDLGWGMYVPFRSEADLYIAENGALIAPHGVARVNAEYLSEVGAIPEIGSLTEIGNGAEFPPSIPHGVYVVRTREGRHVAIQIIGTWSNSLGYRAYGFGYRMLD